jgi:son of sevenless-like protein
MGSFPARKQRLFSKDSNVLVRDPGNIAQHLTLLESKLYIQIKPQECLNWAKVQTGMTVTNILAFSSTRDKITKWVRSSVLKNDSLGKRADTVDFWVQVAEV